MACSYCASSYRSFLVCVILQMSLYLQVIIKMTLFCKSWCVPWHLVGAKLLLLFSTWKKEKMLYFAFDAISLENSEGKKLNVSISEVGRGCRKKRAGKEGGRQRKEREGVCHTERTGERPSATDPQPVHTLMPWSFPRHASTSRWNYNHLGVTSELKARNIWGRTGEASAASGFAFSVSFTADWRKCS